MLALPFRPDKRGNTNTNDRKVNPMKLKFVAATLGFAAGLAAAPAFAAINLVNNGDFETGSLTPAWTVVNAPGSTPANVQIVETNGTTQYFGETFPTSPSGGRYAAYFVSDLANQSISQTLTLDADADPYILSFDLYATRIGNNNPGFFTLTSAVGGNEVARFGTLPGDTAVPVGGWSSYSQAFSVAADGDYVLSFNFTSGGQPAKDILLDNVMVSPIPEPSEYAMMLAGLAAVGFIARRRRRAD